MNATTRALMLFWIELKRCQGIFIAPLLALFSIWFVRDGVTGDVVLWAEAIRQTAEMSILIGCFGAGFAAWQAGRMRRRRATPLVATSPIRFGTTDLLLLLAIVTWMLLSYASVLAYASIVAWRQATWGGPDLLMALAGAMIVVALVAIGGLAGMMIGGMLAPPLAIVFLLIPNMLQVSSGDDPGIFRLIPATFLASLPHGVFFTMPGQDLVEFSVWMCGLALICGAVALLYRARSITPAICAVVVCCIGLIGANRLVAATPFDPRTAEPAAAVPLECHQTATFEVCVHPAYVNIVVETANAVNRAIGPLYGLPGIPPAFNQAPDDGGISIRSTNILPMPVPDQEEMTLRSVLFQQFIVTPTDFAPASDAEVAITQWLIDRAGLRMANPWMEDSETPRPVDEILARAAAFGQLPEAEQHAWLLAHWEELCAGEIALEDMP